MKERAQVFEDGLSTNPLPSLLNSKLRVHRRPVCVRDMPSRSFFWPSRDEMDWSRNFVLNHWPCVFQLSLFLLLHHHLFSAFSICLSYLSNYLDVSRGRWVEPSNALLIAFVFFLLRLFHRRVRSSSRSGNRWQEKVDGVRDGVCCTTRSIFIA